VPVVVAAVERGDLPLVIHTLGTVEASASVAVKARVEGLVIEVAFRDGQPVKAGDLLFRLDPKPFAIALQQAEATLARDRAQLASAQSDLERYGSLSKKGFASTQQLEQSTAQARALRGTVAADEAQVEQARLLLGYTEIRAPMDGVLGAVQVDPGNLVEANGSSALVTLAAVRPVKVSFTLPQQYLPAIQAAQGIPVDVSVAPPPGGFGADIGKTVQGTVSYVASQVERNTGTVELRATVANDDRALLPGQYVDVAVRLGTLVDRLIVPAEALSNGQQGPYVLMVDEQGKAQVVAVRVIYQDGPLAVVESLADAPKAALLQAGGRVVVDGQVRVTPGALVAVKPSLAVSANKGGGQ
jgi:multidrug efflux system membrane fusion protein